MKISSLLSGLVARGAHLGRGFGARRSGAGAARHAAAPAGSEEYRRLAGALLSDAVAIALRHVSAAE